MNLAVKQEVRQLIKELKLNCTTKEFKNKVDWFYISKYQKLYQKLSLDFIREFKSKVDWTNISINQVLSLDFIREFKDKVKWVYISAYQVLSLDFIKEFKDKVDWVNISESQTLSLSFIREFKDKIDIKVHNEVNRKISYSQKLGEIKEYCKKYDLEIDEKNRCFYAFREHDKFGRGMFNKIISYKKNKYYRDWHLDMRENEVNSFGLGIFPKGNTKVKVLFKDWGLRVDREDGKARVWGFEIV